MHTSVSQITILTIYDIQSTLLIVMQIRTKIQKHIILNKRVRRIILVRIHEAGVAT